MLFPYIRIDYNNFAPPNGDNILHGVNLQPKIIHPNMSSRHIISTSSLCTFVKFLKKRKCSIWWGYNVSIMQVSTHQKSQPVAILDFSESNCQSWSLHSVDMRIRFSLHNTYWSHISQMFWPSNYIMSAISISLWKTINYCLKRCNDFVYTFSVNFLSFVLLIRNLIATTKCSYFCDYCLWHHVVILGPH